MSESWELLVLRAGRSSLSLKLILSKPIHILARLNPTIAPNVGQPCAAPTPEDAKEGAPH